MSEIQEHTVTGSQETENFVAHNESPATGDLLNIEPVLQKPIEEDDFVSTSTTAIEDLVNLDAESKSSCITKSEEEKRFTTYETQPPLQVPNVDKIAVPSLQAKGSNDNVKSQEKVEEVSSTSTNSLEEEKHSVIIDSTLKSSIASYMQNHFTSSVVQLIYWKDKEKSAIVFTSGLALMLSLQCCSVIGVITVLGLSALLTASLYRIGMTIVHAVQKTSPEHPFKSLLEEEVVIPEDQVLKMVSKVCQFMNKEIKCLQKLFLINDVIESAKFGLCLWLVSYIAKWFSLLTMIILGFIGLFTIPKLYEEKQNEVDHCIGMMKSKFVEIYGIIEAKVPEKIKVYLCKKDKKE